jgi:phenylpyruvate tautomerase PptA (4-oxalocrotonate tautomerase family)
MPLVRISLAADAWIGRDAEILDAVYRAMHATFAVPENDRFLLLTRHGPGEIDYDRGYPDVARGDGTIFIQITCNDTRTKEQKRALYRTLADELAAAPGVAGDDVFVNLVEVKPENWSFGRGVMQYG